MCIPIGTLIDSNANNHWYTQDGLHMKATGSSIIVPKLYRAMNLAIEKTIVKCKNLGKSADSYTLTDTTPKSIYVTLNPSYTSDRVYWESNNDKIVKVKGDDNYICASITAVANGSTTVVATCGDISTTFNITVALS